MANNPHSVGIASTGVIEIPEIEGNPIHNEILLALPPSERASLFPQLTFVQLRLRDDLEESGQPIKYAYFVDSGLASVLSSIGGRKERGGWTNRQRGMHGFASSRRPQEQRLAYRGSD